MGQQEYQAGANMAFKAFGISDQMQQRQMMQQLQEQQMGQQALQMQLIQAQIKEAERKTTLLATQEGERKAFAPKLEAALTPETRELTIPGGGGDMPATNISQRMPLGREQIQNAIRMLAGQGDPDLFQKMVPGLQGLMPQKWEPSTPEEYGWAKQQQPPQQTSADMQAYERAKAEGFPGTIMDFFKDKQLTKSPKQIERTVVLGDKVEYIYADGTREVKPKGKLPPDPNVEDTAYRRTLVTKTLTEMPTLKKDATTQAGNIERINMALGMVERGVTGKGGQLKAFLAPYAEMAGINTENWNESQTFQLLTRAIVGPMRLDIIGPGPVSEWEQKLMQKISGGGGAAKDAAKELLSFWKQKAIDKVSLYNNTLEGLKTIMPEAGAIHKPIIPNVGEKGSPRDRAISELNKRGKIVNEQSIKQAMELLGGK